MRKIGIVLLAMLGVGCFRKVDPTPPVFVKIPVEKAGAPIVIPPKPMLPIIRIPKGLSEEERDRLILATIETLIAWDGILTDLIEKHNRTLRPQ